MKIRPLADRVVIKRVAPEARSKGGIIIPETAKEKPAEGIIVAVGPGALSSDGRRKEPVVKTGDRVLFTKWSGSEVKVDAEEHVIVREDDILCVFES